VQSLVRVNVLFTSKFRSFCKHMLLKHCIIKETYCDYFNIMHPWIIAVSKI